MRFNKELKADGEIPADSKNLSRASFLDDPSAASGGRRFRGEKKHRWAPTPALQRVALAEGFLQVTYDEIHALHKRY